MKTTRREFLQTSALATLAASQPLNAADQMTLKDAALDGFALAGRHAITRDIPTPSFFEGMPLGNGDVGVCVVVRPDALGLHIGKNDCWDIRMTEEQTVATFPELLKMWQRASDEAKRQGKPDMVFLESNIDFLSDYSDKTTSYSKPWPRVWPCGTVWVHWDPRWVQPRVHTLSPANGVFTLDLLCTALSGEARVAKLTCFVDWATGLISVSTDTPVAISWVSYDPRIDEGLLPTTNSAGDPQQDRSTRVEALPRPEFGATSDASSAEFFSFQYFPAIGPTTKVPNPPRSDKDRNFSLHARLEGNWSLRPTKKADDKKTSVGLNGNGEQRFRMDIKLATPRDILLERLEREAAASGTPPWVMIPQNHAYSAQDLDTRSYVRNEIKRMAGRTIDQIQQASTAQWRDFWSASAIQLQDQELERVWYLNQYFLACCLRAGKTAPGLFGNWSAGDLGVAWHGDYHLDYNCEQVFWGVFSSNHVEQHLPYVEMCQNLLDASRKYAQENYELPGACFPLVAVPVPSQSVFVPSPSWGYQISNTPWTVQSLWWQYLYTQDEEYLRHVYPMLQGAAEFVTAYAKKGDDGKYHIIPTVSPENWGFTVDFRLNKDCILDLALIRFLLDAVIEGSTVLKVEDDATRARWRELRDNLTPYPQVEGPYGEVWLDIANGPPETVYNVPVTLSPVFPGEQVGIGRNPEQMELAKRTARTIRLEGDNDLVFQPLIRARLGILDLNWFRREIRYCSLPNGISNDRVRQIGGRHDDASDFDFMMRMGFWTENLSLPVVLNECMMQSYTGTIRLFPNTENLGPAKFDRLRAAGAFLVSAAFDGKEITHFSLLSEKGKSVRVSTPWPNRKVKAVRVRDSKTVNLRWENEVLSFDTEANEVYRLEAI